MRHWPSKKRRIPWAGGPLTQGVDIRVGADFAKRGPIIEGRRKRIKAGIVRLTGSQFATDKRTDCSPAPTCCTESWCHSWIFDSVRARRDCRERLSTVESSATLRRQAIKYSPLTFSGTDGNLCKFPCGVFVNPRRRFAHTLLARSRREVQACARNKPC